MIGDVIERSVREQDRVIPVEALLGNCSGSRMPDIVADRLTPAIVERITRVCPTAALTTEEFAGRSCLRLSYGRCIGCGRCIEAGEGAVAPATKFVWSGVPKDQTVRFWDASGRGEPTRALETPEAVRAQIHSLLQRALNIREVAAGSCNGPVTRNMADSVRDTYEAVPAPKLVVAVGACGCSGGIFEHSHAIIGAVDDVIPVDAYIPGCPPTPATLVTGILRALQRCRPKHLEETG